MKNPQQPLIDLENRYDGPIPASIREQMGRTSDPRTARRLELESIVERSTAEAKRAESSRDFARKAGLDTHARFLEIERRYHQDRKTLAQALLEREQFDD